MANDSNENKIMILFLSANPRGSPKLNVIKECNEVREEIKSARYGRHFSVEQEHQASKEKLQKYLLETNPQIVHFAGHGDDDAEDGVLLFQDAKGKKQKASAEDIAELFRILNERNIPDKEKIRCVVLNACLTLDVANAISTHVECVIGMSNKISDTAARVFARSFYFALASGESVQTSSALGSDQLKKFDIPTEDMIAKLISRDDKDPRWIYFQKKEDTQREPAIETRSKLYASSMPRTIETENVPRDASLIEKRNDKMKMGVKNILFFTADAYFSGLNLDQEYSEIKRRLSRSKSKGKFKLERIKNPKREELQDIVMRKNPNIIHFAGNADGKSIALFKKDGEPAMIPYDSFSNQIGILNRQNRIKLVFLNACDTEPLMNLLVKHVDYVIGMTGMVSDKASIVFAETFYNAMIHGYSIEDAFNLGKERLKSEGLDREANAQLASRKSFTGLLSSPPQYNMVNENESVIDTNPKKIASNSNENRNLEKKSATDSAIGPIVKTRQKIKKARKKVTGIDARGRSTGTYHANQDIDEASGNVTGVTI